MNQAAAAEGARALMDEYGLSECPFAFDNARKRLGACHWKSGKLYRITLSRHYVALNDWDTMRDVVLHEIAHALSGPRAGHNALWRANARKVGAKPERCNDTAEAPPAPYVAECCGRVVGRRYRKPARSRIYHVACGTQIEWRRVG